MQNQKLENTLNLSLDLPEETREMSPELRSGYNPIDRTWELIAKISDKNSETMESVAEYADEVTELMGEYVILKVRESNIGPLSMLPQMEYIEQPKRLYFQAVNGRRFSCIDEVQGSRLSLSGQGVLVAVLDSGIDYQLSEFRNVDGSSRIRAIWDQSLKPVGGEQSPEGYARGVEYLKSQIDEAIRLGEREGAEASYRIVRTRDISGHGTAVAGVAAGDETGVAGGSELLIVKLGSPEQEGFPRTAELMMAVDYAVRKALEYRMPVAINISFGNTYGAHDGTSLLERYIDDMTNIWKSGICIGTGNEAASAGHASGQLREQEREEVELAVQEYQPNLSIQIWKQYVDEVEVGVVSPNGKFLGLFQETSGVQKYVTGQTEVYVYYGAPSPYSISQEIFIELLPAAEVTEYIASGEWKIVLIPQKVISGRYHMWLPSEGALNRGTGFRFPSSESTLTIPSTASRAIGVGAYHALSQAYADFSGRGPLTGESRSIRKPDLVAPGVDVLTTAAGGGYQSVSGTSFAAPFVTGSAALLMEWGIRKGNDPYLYGEKLKAYLRRGAKPLPGYLDYPNSQIGYGTLCVKDSIPDRS